MDVDRDDRLYICPRVTRRFQKRISHLSDFFKPDYGTVSSGGDAQIFHILDRLEFSYYSYEKFILATLNVAGEQIQIVYAEEIDNLLNRDIVLMQFILIYLDEDLSFPASVYIHICNAFHA